MTKETFNSIWKQLQTDIKDTKFENHVYIVGGSVRDFLNENEINDIDLAIDLPNGGKEFAEWYTKKYKCNSNFNPITYGRADTAKFIINSPILKDVKFEAVQTMLNMISNATDKNDLSKNLGNIADDAMCRDFTCNAIYIDVSGGYVLDPLDGCNDISEKIVTTTSSPDAIFNDDPLRMMRAIRIASNFGWGIDKRTWFGILKNAYKIKEVAVERVRDEFNKILLLREPSVALDRLLNSGLLFYILPDFYRLNKIGQNYNCTIPNQWQHTLNVVDRSDAILVNRLACFLHDIGKLTTFRFDGRTIKYIGHENSCVILIDKILNQYKYPITIINLVKNICQLHTVFDSSIHTNTLPKDKNIRKMIDKFGKDFNTFSNVLIANYLAKGDKYLEYAINLEEKMEEIQKEMIEDNERPTLTLPIDGNELMKVLDIKSGPIVGELLKNIKEKMFENPSLTKDEAIEFAKGYINSCTNLTHDENKTETQISVSAN